MAAESQGSAKRSGTAGQKRRKPSRRRRRDRRTGEAAARSASGLNVTALRELIRRSVLAPVNAVLLTRKHIEEVVEDAVTRGRMTRDDAQQLMQSLLQRGAKQTDDFLSELERVLGRGRDLESPDDTSTKRQEGGRRRTARAQSDSPSPALPIDGYDGLSAPQVQERLDGLSPAQLRKLRDYERRHANRKTVLDRIERRLR